MGEKEDAGHFFDFYFSFFFPSRWTTGGRVTASEGKRRQNSAPALCTASAEIRKKPLTLSKELKIVLVKAYGNGNRRRVSLPRLGQVLGLLRRHTRLHGPQECFHRGIGIIARVVQI